MAIRHEPQEIRVKLWQLLGDFPPLFIPQAELIKSKQYETFRLEHLAFDNGIDARVYAYLLIPNEIKIPAPAVLYHHIHGGKYALGKEMILQIQANGYADGIALVEAGFIVLAIDAYAFGERQHQGPMGNSERGAETELSLFKQFLWEGKTLWGMMLHDDLLALAYLRSREEVDSERIGTTGMSLGGSRATWLAALDEKIKVIIPIAQLTRYADFAATGNYALHSIYYYLPSMLKSGLDMEHLVSLAAPNYQRILIGSNDPLSPISGIEKVIHYARDVYSTLDASDKLEVEIYKNIAHVYTPTMCEAMLEGFRLYL